MDISQRIDDVKQQIRAAELKYNRPPGSVQILAVSKSQSTAKIEVAYNAGQRLFGENYLQEAVSKIQELRALPIEWHFIGKIQSNKTRLIAEHFSWVQSIDKLKHAHLLNQYRSSSLPKLNVCIQVNISRSVNKSGINVEDLPEFAKGFSNLKNLELRGLMAIPDASDDFSAAVKVFQQLQSAQQELIQQGFALDMLSMGMTQDFEAAIAAGSTLVRIGTGIFGSRTTGTNMSPG